MNDASFINLLNEQNFSKINIDSRLVDSFKRVMNKLQAYFNANGYTSERNYAEFFEQYLLKDMPDKLKIVISNEPSKIGFAGFYRYSGGVQEIHIDESCLHYNIEYFDSVLCHEFIHFLVMRGLDKINCPDFEIKNGGFINEALTEMLNQQMYPNSCTYQPQVDMLKFANLLTGNVNNYSRFLRGKVDSKQVSSSWNNFFGAANAYQAEWKDKGFIMSGAINDPNYLSAQRHIIHDNISIHLISSFEEYEKWFNMLQQRPAPDNEFIQQFFTKMDKFLINNLGLQNSNLQEIMMQHLLAYRQNYSLLEMYDGKDVYEFEIAGHKVAIDKDRNLYNKSVLGSYSSAWNSNTGIYEIKVGNETIKLDINKIDFEKRKREILERQKTIPNYFLPTSKGDVKAVSQIAQTEGLVKLEKFTLPLIEVSGKKTPTIIYVATYEDRIEILNDVIQIGTMENVRAAQYLGGTSQDPNASLICTKPLESIEKGIVYSKYSRKFLIKKTVQTFAQKIKTTLSLEQLKQMVEQFKKSPEFESEDSLTDNEIQELAIMKYAKEQYDRLTEEERKQLFDEVANSQDRFIISTKDGKVEVSLLFGNQIITAYKGKSEVLVDFKCNGLYNEHYKILSNNKDLVKKVDSEIISINGSGDIVFTDKKNNGDDSIFNQEQIQTPYIKPETIQKVRQMEQYRKKYGYDNMNPSAKEEFDRRIRNLLEQQEKVIEESKRKKELQEQRRSLRKQQFEEKLKQMGLYNEPIIDLEQIFREQQMIEQQIIKKMMTEQEEKENDEEIGMQM